MVSGAAGGDTVGMTDREKREKVINGLAHCVSDNCNGDNWDKCEYSGHGCIDALLEDALALLKAREPDEDWISRKRLRDEIQYYIEEAGWGDEVNKVLGWCLEFIDNQEAVKWE